jgi:hypothetical protein
LAAAAGMSAYYLSKRREEEEAQRRAVQEQVAAKNDALRAKEAQMREQAKIENYLQGKAMLEAALKDSNLSDEAKAAIKEQAKTNGMAAGLNLTAGIIQSKHGGGSKPLFSILPQDKDEEKDDAERIYGPPTHMIGPKPLEMCYPDPLYNQERIDWFDLSCKTADAIDPWAFNPATHNTGGISGLIDDAARSTPPNTLVGLLVKGVKLVKDYASTPYNFYCQQKAKEGTYYEMFPADKKVNELKNHWNGLSTTGKVTVIVVAIIVVLIAIPILPP